MIPIRLIRSSKQIEYSEALSFMEQYVDLMLKDNAPGCLWLLEHPPTITAGTSATDADLINAQNIPVHQTNRGGKYTYHGPGQRIAYIMLNLTLLKKDIRYFVQQLERWLINTFKVCGLHTHTSQNRVGIWITNKETRTENKLAAIGLRVKKWICFHGVAINLSPDLKHFQNIVPCGIKNYGVTSLEKEGFNISTQQLDEILIKEFCKIFGTKIIESCAKLF